MYLVVLKYCTWFSGMAQSFTSRRKNHKKSDNQPNNKDSFLPEQLSHQLIAFQWMIVQVWNMYRLS